MAPPTASHAPIRRRASAADPLKKVTIRLHTRVADAVRSAVDAGDAPSADAFIEDAIVAALREQRRARLYAAYAQAAQDPDFVADMTDTTRAFDAVLADRTDANA